MIPRPEGPTLTCLMASFHVTAIACAPAGYPGSATGWENAIVPDSAFVVELPAGSCHNPTSGVTSLPCRRSGTPRLRRHPVVPERTDAQAPLRTDIEECGEGAESGVP